MAEEEATQTCNVCRLSLPIARFDRDRTSKSGYAHRCKRCYAERRAVREASGAGRLLAEQRWRKQDAKRSASADYRAAKRERSRRERPNYREASRERTRLYRDRFPEKAAARAAVKNAVASGALVRPDRCEKCGDLDRRGADGRRLIHAHHHQGYDNPLAVQWLCAICHAAAHRHERSRQKEMTDVQ